MKPLPLSTLATWCGAAAPAQDPLVCAVLSDSRAIGAGALFVALPGERVDGHDFVAAAARSGAVAALVSRPIAIDLPQLLVADPLHALGRIAAGLRRHRTTRVLGLTGSNGKTTVKSLLAGILSLVGDTYANPGNRNNELGLPLALIDQPEDAAFAIYEMGAGAPGDIAYLADIAQPQIALVNNIGPAHLQRLGSLLGVAQTKGAIYAALPADGTAVINADDAFGLWFEQHLDQQRCRRFGLEASADVVAEHIRTGEAGSTFRLCAPEGSIDIDLHLPGRHNIANALAAASMALAANASLCKVAQGLNAAQGVAGRLQMHRLPSGALLIDDSYNANPGSVAAAIDTLAASAGERWLVLGDMRELGVEATALHAQIGERARAAGLQHLWTVGEWSAHAAMAFGANARHFATQAELSTALAGALAAGVTCLVKGSRGSRMDRIVDALLGRRPTSHAA